MQKIVFLFAALFFFQKAAALPRSLPIESKSESDGAGAIVFDTSRISPDSSDSSSIFKFNLKDSEVEFFAEGFWQSAISSEMNFSGGFGSDWKADFSTPVFSQNVDLSLFLTVDQKWYFEADFADEFSRNTVALGYQNGETVKSARIANRGIKFPSIYSADLLNLGIGGGDNEAPGFSINLSGKKWRADGVFRYDLVKSAEKIWLGKNSVSTQEIKLSAWEEGTWFALPDGASGRIARVFVENSKGGFSDESGRKFAEIDSTKYLAASAKNSLFLSADAKSKKSSGKLPVVAVVISGGIDGNSLREFWKSTKELFSGADLDEFSFFGGDISNAFCTIGGETALILQTSAGFSPFAVACRYNLGTLSSAKEAKIASKSTQTAVSSFSVSVGKDDLVLSKEDFFGANCTYATVSLESEFSPLDAKFRFPLAQSNPECYLGTETDSGNAQNDNVLLVRSFSPVSRYEIGTNAVSGSIQVYKNGILDAGAKYDEENGTITPSVQIGAADTLRAVWFEEGDGNSGSIAAEIGFKRQISKNWQANVSSAARWTALSKDSAEIGEGSSAYFANAAGAEYKGKSISFKTAHSVSLENDNNTDLLRLLGMDKNSSKTRYFQKIKSYSIPKNFVPILNCQNAPSLSAADFLSAEDKTAQTDSEISGYAIPISWTSETSENAFWIARTIPLPISNSELASAAEFEIALKKSSYCGERVFLQLGVEAAESFDFVESRERVFTKEITDEAKAADSFKSGTISFALSDSDRAKIAKSGSNGLRIVVLAKESGSILVGPVKASAISFAFSADSFATVSSFEERCEIDSKTVKKLNDDDNFAQVFKIEFDEGCSDSKILASRYFEKTQISNYEKIAFFMKIGENRKKTPDSLSKVPSPFCAELSNADGEIAAKFSIPFGEIQKIADGKWREISVDLDEKSLEIAGTKISAEIFVDTDVQISKFKIEWNPVFGSEYASLLYLDELHLSGARGRVAYRGFSEIAWKMQKEHGALKKASAKATLNSIAAKNFGGSSNAQNILSVSGDSQISIFSASAQVSVENAFLKSASHTVKAQKSDFFSFSESFSFASDSSSKKSSSAQIQFKNASISAESASKIDAWSKTQDAKAQLSASVFGVNANAAAVAAQTLKESGSSVFWQNAYAENSRLSFSFGESGAQKIGVGASGDLSKRFAFLSISPKISFSSEGESKSAIFADSSSAKISIPLSVQKNALLFSYKKSAGGTKSASAEKSYKDEAAFLAQTVFDRNWFLSAFFVQDLISGELSKSVWEDGKKEESAFYSSNYEVSWKRNFSLSAIDFWIPKSAGLSFSRDIRAATSQSDLYQAKIKIANSSANIFGKKGLVPIFSWYEQDEFSSSFSISAKIPRKSPKNWSRQVDAYLQAVFVIKEGNELKTGLEGSFSSADDWSAKATAIWKRNAKSAFAASAVDFFWKGGRGKQRKHTKTDSVNFKAASASSSTKITRTYRAEYSHKVDSELSKFVTLNTAVGAVYSAVWEKSASLGANASIGITVKF